jgi:RimJ/RimL family protein N-acetyltransferase
MSAPIVIETERLLLRPHVADDWDAVCELWANAAVVRFISGRPSTREQSWAKLLCNMGLWPALGFGYFVVIDKSTQKFIGEIGLADFHRDIVPSLEGFAEMGWVLTPHAWGKGFASEAIMAILEWYSQTPNPRPITCIINRNNKASVKLALKCGFQETNRSPYKYGRTLTFRRA